MKREGQGHTQTLWTQKHTKHADTNANTTPQRTADRQRPRKKHQKSKGSSKVIETQLAYMTIRNTTGALSLFQVLLSQTYDPSIIIYLSFFKHLCIYLRNRVTERQRRDREILHLQVRSNNDCAGHNWARCFIQTSPICAAAQAPGSSSPLLLSF